MGTAGGFFLAGEVEEIAQSARKTAANRVIKRQAMAD